MATEKYLIQLAVQVQNDKQLQALTKELQRAAKAVPKVQKGMQAATKGTKNFGNTAQNAGYQIQDMAVQIQGGVDPMRAMSQQLPQMLVGFGAWGAAIGVVAALLPTLVSTLSDTTGEIQELDESLDANTDAWNDYATALDRVEKSGTEADAVISGILGTIAQAQQARTIESMRADAADMLETIRGFKQVTEEPASGGGWFDGILDVFREAKAIGAGGDLAGISQEVKEIATGFAEIDRFGGVDNFEEFSRIIRDMNSGNIQQTVISVGQLLDNMRGVASPELIQYLEQWVQQLNSIRNSATDATDRLEEVEVTAGRITGSATGPSPEALARIRENDYRQQQREYEAGPEWAADVIKQVEEANEIVGIFDRTFQSTVEGIAMGTQDISDAFKSMAQSIIAQLGKLAAEWLSNLAVRSLFGGTVTPAADGAVIDGGGMAAFAKGGVVNRPTIFPMANGAGLMGEAGPEAIMPLKRGANGELGVQGGGMNVTVNNNVAGAEVQTRQTDNGLTIDLVMGAVANAVRRGGNDVSSAFEQSYSLGRGRAIY